MSAIFSYEAQFCRLHFSKKKWNGVILQYIFSDKNGVIIQNMTNAINCKRRNIEKWITFQNLTPKNLEGFFVNDTSLRNFTAKNIFTKLKFFSYLAHSKVLLIFKLLMSARDARLVAAVTLVVVAACLMVHSDLMLESCPRVTVAGSLVNGH